MARNRIRNCRPLCTFPIVLNLQPPISLSIQLIILQDPELRDVAPRIIDVLSQRLEGEYMRISEGNAHDPALRKIAALARQARELKSLAR